MRLPERRRSFPPSSWIPSRLRLQAAPISLSALRLRKTPEPSIRLCWPPARGWDSNVRKCGLSAYVMEAKRQVQGEVRIESLPGNSEILVIADDSANPRYVAADLLSQAEHAGGEMSILVTVSEGLLDRVDAEVEKQLAAMRRKEIAESSLSTGGVLVLVRDVDQACEIANEVAPEHLEIQVKSPKDLVPKIRHAGAVFLGPWSTEPIGDYTAGTNHVLPTGGTARYSSALSVDDYTKKISVVEIDEEGLLAIGPPATKLAAAEGLEGHKNAIDLRLRDLEG